MPQSRAPKTYAPIDLNASDQEKKIKGIILHVAPYTHFITLPTRPLIFSYARRTAFTAGRELLSELMDAHASKKKKTKLKYICLTTRAPYIRTHTKNLQVANDCPFYNDSNLLEYGSIFLY